MGLHATRGTAARTIGFVVALTTSMVASAPAGATVPREVLKTYFETGDIPTQDQFQSLIDSMLHYTDDRYLIGLRMYDPATAYLPGDTVPIKRFGVGDTTPVSPLEYVNPHTTPILLQPDFAGQFGFAAMMLQDSAGIYYGFLQIQMDAPPSSSGVSTSSVTPGPAIHVQYLAYNETPNTPLTMFVVPEPASAALVLCAITPLLLRRSRESA